MTDRQAIAGSNAEGDVRQLWREVGSGLQLRRALVEREVRYNLRTLRRLAVVGVAGGVLVLVGLPVLLHVLADALSRVTDVSATSWAVGLAALCVVPGLAVLITAIRRFRRDFTGLQYSRDELNEDLLWVREWLQNAPADERQSSSAAGGP